MILRKPIKIGINIKKNLIKEFKQQIIKLE